MAGQPRRRTRNAERRRLLGVPYRGDLVDPRDPQELLALYSEALGAARLLLRDARRQYRALGEDWRFTDDHGGEQLRSEITVLQTQISSTARILNDVVRVNLEARRVQLEAQQAELIANFVLRIIEDPAAQLTAAQKLTARRLVAEEMVALVGVNDATRNGEVTP